MLLVFREFYGATEIPFARLDRLLTAAIYNETFIRELTADLHSFIKIIPKVEKD